ncbi:MAG: helix-turn-helix domain-containing protein [Candidatus Angelobacter sp.]
MLAYLIVGGYAFGVHAGPAQWDGQQRRITTVSVRRIMRQQAGTESIPKKEAGRHQNLAPPSMTVTEAANYLGASKSSIRRWRSSGILEDASPDAGKVNGERVTTASVQKLLKSEKAAGWRKRSTIERK